MTLDAAELLCPGCHNPAGADWTTDGQTTYCPDCGEDIR